MQGTLSLGTHGGWLDGLQEPKGPPPFAAPGVPPEARAGARVGKGAAPDKRMARLPGSLGAGNGGFLAPGPRPSALQALDVWTVSALMASSHLARLYRTLRDDRQAGLALEARGMSEERALRYRLMEAAAELGLRFAEDHPDETEGEARAWQLLVEAHAGMHVLYSVMDQDPAKSSHFRGARTATAKALCRSVHGYRVAFPDVMAEDGVLQSLEAASHRIADLLMPGEAGVDEEEILRRRQAIHDDIMEALSAMAEACSLGRRGRVEAGAAGSR